MGDAALLEAIRGENLAVYRVSPGRLKEDVGQEAEIAHDYRGRLVYELLQNADDAMLHQAGDSDQVVFRLTDDSLWVGNSGRPLNEGDVAGLCGIGASTKSEHSGPRRASIGHKGMGFKSVLEVTETPEAYSADYQFRMDAALALEPVREVMRELGRPRPDRAPAMRFPWHVDMPPDEWFELRSTAGINTLFRFPLRRDLTAEQRRLLAHRLISLPLTAVLFLKHLEHVRIEVATSDVSMTRTLAITRHELTPSGWESSSGLATTGTYRVDIEEAGADAWSFLLAHNADVPLEDHRGGLDPYAWEGIEFTEVSVAAPHPASGMTLPVDWRRFHVFLPTGEPTPWGMLVNGAFATDLSRQEIRVGDESDDYNRFLIGEVATLFRDQLLPALEHEGATTTALLDLLERDSVPAARRPAQELHHLIAARLRWLPLLPDGVLGDRIAIGHALVPAPIGSPGLGSRVRGLLGATAGLERLHLPCAELCDARYARILRDLGARAATATEVVELLAAADPVASRLAPHPISDPSGEPVLSVDPVLDVLVDLWAGASPAERAEIVAASRRLPLFPIAAASDGTVTRVATDGVTCFYPPRHLVRDVPLTGLQFLLHDICWGRLIPRDRNELLRDRMSGWLALFEVREFRFPDVMRASVLPALDLDGESSATAREALESLDRIAAICQLSGRTPKPHSPLPYERLGTERALFNLARLPIPCRGVGDEIRWVPAFRAYFGFDWVGDSSVEVVLAALDAAGVPELKRPRFDFVVSPARLSGLLARYSDLKGATEDSDATDDEVSVDEDEEVALERDERAQWLAFLTWIGVNRALRPIHFHDVEDRAAGWLTTRDLQKPKGHAFVNLGKVWDSWVGKVKQEVAKSNPDGRFKVFFTQLHVLDALMPLVRLAAEDDTAVIARSVYEHVARNWTQLERFSRLELAFVPKERDPGARTKPARPAGDETRDTGMDFWLAVLRSRAIVPTLHGPRKPGQAWLPSGEITRRFGGKHKSAGDLIPLVDVAPMLLEGKARTFALTLGIRAELAPASFRPSDADLIATRLQERYGAAAADGSLTDEVLRRVMRPAYRNVFELLVGSADRGQASAPHAELAETPLLVTDGAGHYRFDPAQQVLYTDRPGMRERLGNPEGLWLFVLEATPAARAPLLRLFGSRLIDAEVDWRPIPGEPALQPEERRRFRDGMVTLLPYLLSRLRVERSEEQQAATDARQLSRFIDTAELVDGLEISAFLDGVELSSRAARDAFVDLRDPAEPRAFLRWGANGWPPTNFEAEALASALAELYQANLFEPFLTLVQAHSDDLRRRLLRLAGASTDLADVLLSVEEDTVPDDALDFAPRTAPGADPDDAPVSSRGPDEQARIPLFSPEQLVVDGTPELTVLDGPPTQEGGADKDGAHHGGTPVNRAAHGYGSLTDLTELDRLGMSVTIAYEHARLARAGVAAPQDLVFDVSNPARFDEARRRSKDLDRAVSWLRDHGLDPGWPGFDIFTLDPANPSLPGRLIELKSSGVNATTQTMTWNEWKSARHSAIRRYFWLYLAGNLRSDLAHARPFVRAIPDPFATLWSEVETKLHRSIQLNLLQFQQSEFLELTVTTPPGDAHDG